MIVYKEFAFDNNNAGNLAGHLDNHVKSVIEHDDGLEGKDILLNYPVVYIHTWKNGRNNLCVYVGETINLVRRTGEHDRNDKKDSWQQEWSSAKDRRSYYFSDRDMNKSLALDIEDSLIALFIRVLGNNTKNKRINGQGGYDNKYRREPVLKEIWNIIKSPLGLADYDSLIKSPPGLVDYDSVIREVSLTSGKDEHTFVNGTRLVKQKTLFKVSSESGIRPVLQEMIQDTDPSVLDAYPVVYMHIWKDNSGRVSVYTGETNNLLKRTVQHYNNEPIDYDIDQFTGFEKDADWHESWREAISCGRAYMCFFVRADMNISVTRDIENYLIRYNTVLGVSVNGRRNEQREYSNRGIAHSIFSEITDYLAEWKYYDKSENPVFCSLEDIKEKSAFMSSPLLELSKEQRKAKTEIQDSMIEALTDSRHSLLVIDGEAGTGKTVLISGLLFDMCDSVFCGRVIKTKLFINHQELFNAYTVQADARGIVNDIDYISSITGAEEWINKVKEGYLQAVLPYYTRADQNTILEALSETDEDIFRDRFYGLCLSVNRNECVPIDSRKKYLWKNIKVLIEWAEKKGIEMPDHRLDIALVDEAHLIRSKGDNGGIKEAQLPIIFDNSRVVVIMIDPKQFLDPKALFGPGYLSGHTIESQYRSFLSDHGIKGEFRVKKIAELKKQFRMNCSLSTKNWIGSLYEKGSPIRQFPHEDRYEFRKIGNDRFVYEKDENGEIIYEIGVFSSKDGLREAIENKKRNEQNPSCLIASYCWPNGDKSKTSPVMFKDSEYPYRWHQTGRGASDKEASVWTMEKTLIQTDKKGVPYVEVGAYHDIQGFDLNYAGVILGESIMLGTRAKNKNRIVFSKRSKDGDNMRPGVSASDIDTLVGNEIGVLLSRGRKGLYIYVVDDNYREALLKAVSAADQYES